MRCEHCGQKADRECHVCGAFLCSKKKCLDEVHPASANHLLEFVDEN